ncbi:Alg9-like mannosyltransferase family-domain-containing protein [Syncephalis pseudoplumigaleata]|uniref:Mannosyltransferase n=1 Tax=Syncephalis pseudoplumigaleata TaxID=1712513 RepID=A0A4P9Z148_9FUNG|nr:Alg9-like mannosyltransferase family-domain-containing protein [Syncephalis pseudoplumigaleata]|eukprot:RKP25110.1 Alg9-like mannosyltransferase family-domain-containing protein [Syncephalis pseudoplumigaleata]
MGDKAASQNKQHGRRAGWRPDIIDLLLVCLASFHVIVAPFTKVEEQFNVEALHDLLYHGWSRLDKYNHTAYPGPVPRTFIGPLFLYSMVKPVQAIWYYIDPAVPKVYLLVLVTVAFAYWLEGVAGGKRSAAHIYTALRIILVAGLWFRSELAALFVPWVLLELFSRRIELVPAIRSSLWAALYAIPLTVAVDSYFWQKFPKWPEFDVFWFNAIDLRSSEWGVSPWHAYFTTLIPRILHVALPLAAYGAWSNRGVRTLLWPMLVFVSLYSALGHKEWRFIMYIAPIVNLAAAVGLAQLFSRQSKHIAYRLWLGIAAAGLCAALIAQAGMLYISSLNYPGGYAVAAFHKLEANQTSVYMHMDVLTHMTGGSGFSQQRDDWRYSRNESHQAPEEYEQYTHLVTEFPAFHSKAFEQLAAVRGLAGIRIKRPREYIDHIAAFLRERSDDARQLE